jgi:hypothetical protein
MPAKKKTLTSTLPVVLYPEAVQIGQVKRVHTFATETKPGRTRFTPKDPYNLGSFDTFTEAKDAMATAWRAERQR